MKLAFNRELAEAMGEFRISIIGNSIALDEFKRDPTGVLKAFLTDGRVPIPTPDMFHAHAIKIGEQLPQEPEHATCDRYIYVFRESGLFEFKVVPGGADGNDDLMINPQRACACCNCGCFEVP
jgi:hypothetical protein